jgi:hypothetical protein
MTVYVTPSVAAGMVQAIHLLFFIIAEIFGPAGGAADFPRGMQERESKELYCNKGML